MKKAKKPKLSERYQKVLVFLEEYIHQYGFPPSVRDILDHCDFSTTSNVHYCLDRLEENGYISREKGLARGIRLLRSISQFTSEVWRVPLSGPVQAGLPIPLPPPNFSIYDEYDCVDVLAGDLPYSPDYFALRVQGDSMIDALVNDGDIIILQRTQDASNGDMVAALVEGGATLKYFYRKEDKVILQPANPAYKPIEIKDPEAIEIQGKVVMVKRRYSK